MNAEVSGVTKNISPPWQTLPCGPNPKCVLYVSQALGPLEFQVPVVMRGCTSCLWLKHYKQSLLEDLFNFITENDGGGNGSPEDYYQDH
ncbi:hypothetical protein TNCV_5059021 [Trichonephila clavipes]|nr:hypothetical protein TNCV_5059021 [Trichonephila clavipes]